ncbi:MAG: hypothetical protein IKM20_00180 [Erysipelotrichales bacterium]|nr:hypothetical protein [Erysipelotrichales bacterium]
MANIITSNYTYYSNPTQVKSGEFWYDDGSSSTISMDSFLSLMIAELSNQDFNNATDTSEFTQQLAVYAQVEAMNQMVEYSQINYASSLIGKDIAVIEPTTQQVKYGKVNAINMMNGELEVFVDGVTYGIEDVVQVYPTEEKTDYDALVKKLLDGMADLKSDADSSLSSSFTSTLERLLEAIEELLAEREDVVDDEVIEDVESTEEVETESTTETPVVDTTEEAAQENASSVASEELNTTL